MKVTVIDGSPTELAEYEAQTGLVAQAIGASRHTMDDSGQGPAPIQHGEAVIGDSFERQAKIRSFIFSRARTPVVGARVDDYIGKVEELADVVVEIGTSKARADGYHDYLLIYDAGPRRYGAVAYVSAKNAGLTLRLGKQDVTDVGGRVILRDVKADNVYEVNCPLRDAEAVGLAVELTQRALKKVRGQL